METDYHVILLDETEYADVGVLRLATKLYGAYAFNRSSKHQHNSIMSTYELHPLNSVVVFRDGVRKSTQKRLQDDLAANPVQETMNHSVAAIDSYIEANPDLCQKVVLPNSKANPWVAIRNIWKNNR